MTFNYAYENILSLKSIAFKIFSSILDHSYQAHDKVDILMNVSKCDNSCRYVSG